MGIFKPHFSNFKIKSRCMEKYANPSAKTLQKPTKTWFFVPNIPKNTYRL